MSALTRSQGLWTFFSVILPTPTANNLMNHTIYDRRKRARQSKNKLDTQNSEQARMEPFLAPKRAAYADQVIAKKPDEVHVDSSENAGSDENEEICEIRQQIDPPENELNDEEDLDDDEYYSCMGLM